MPFPLQLPLDSIATAVVHEASAVPGCNGTSFDRKGARCWQKCVYVMHQIQ